MSGTGLLLVQLAAMLVGLALSVEGLVSFIRHRWSYSPKKILLFWITALVAAIMIQMAAMRHIFFVLPSPPRLQHRTVPFVLNEIQPSCRA